VRRMIAVCALVLGLLAGCGDPDQKMLADGARAARDAASEVGTAQLAARSLLDHKLWNAPAVQLVTDAEQALGKVTSTFDAQQPGTGRSRQIYDTVSKALSTAEDNLTELRIALNNNDLGAVADQVTRLQTIGQQLERLGEQAK
jgi:predicted ArsR family transcriptional regulator